MTPRRGSQVAGAGGEGFAGRRWTVMVYMAADNDLEAQARADLAEIKSVGSTPEVTMVAQLDPARPGEATRRYYLSRIRSLEGDAVDPPLGETNTGDARDLARFIVWAMDTYPADRYALVLWNHGIGWGDLGGGFGRGAAAPSARHPIFRATAESILARGIAWDATSQDFMDNAEIKRALDAARRWAKERRFRVGAQVLRGVARPEEAGRAFSDVAEACLAAGISPVAHLEGGFGAWKAAKLPYVAIDPATGGMRRVEPAGT